jgi:hypothetical protein
MYTLKDACAEIDDKLHEMGKKANFIEKNRELILRVEKITSEGLKASVRLHDLMPKYAKKRITLLASVYSSQDRDALFAIYSNEEASQFLNRVSSLPDTTFQPLSKLVDQLATKRLTEYHLNVLVSMLQNDPGSL